MISSKSLKLLRNNEELINSAKKLNEVNQHLEVLYEAAEEKVIRLFSYSRQPSSILEIRLKLFHKTIAKSKKGIQIVAILPTKLAPIQHTQRVYLQVQLWLEINLYPEYWGWKRTFILVPVMKESPAAPLSLLHQVYKIT